LNIRSDNQRQHDAELSAPPADGVLFEGVHFYHNQRQAFMTDGSNYRWYVLILAALTMSLTVAMPGMCMPVLFDEISTDLGLSRTQIGIIWGSGALPGILIALVGGSIGDRFGPKRVLIVACLLSGATGALRGLSANFLMLIGTGADLGAGQKTHVLALAGDEEAAQGRRTVSCCHRSLCPTLNRRARPARDR
jgi:hypothetical protein